MIKFSCVKVFLQNAIAVTSRAVAQKSSIPALEGLLIHADQQLTISGYNMQTGIRTNVFANVVEGGDIVLNARLFGDIIRRMPDDMITFTADEKMMVHVSCGDADFDILGLSAADYPDLPEVLFQTPQAGQVGRELLERDHTVITDYGLLRRKDGGQLPVFQPEHQENEITGPAFAGM